MSNLIPREFINELLNRCDLVELIDERVPLKKKGANYSACCPFHQEKTPSFTVSQVKQFYHCFGCNASGNAIGFLIEYDRLTFVEAVEQLARQLGMTIPQSAIASSQQTVQAQPELYPLMAQVAKDYEQQLRSAPQAIEYLKNRGLSGQIAKEFAIGFAPAGWDHVYKKFGTNPQAIQQLFTLGLLIKKDDGGYYDRFRDRVMFPIRDRRGRVIAFGGRSLGAAEPKYLNSPETPIFHKGNELYGLYEVARAIREIKSLLVVEGYMDVVALAQHEIRNVVATLGTATTVEHIQRLFRVTPEIIFCFDGDKAGQAAAWRALEIALSQIQDGRQIKFLILPTGEDPDSLVRKEGTAAFTQRIQHATPLADFLFSTLTNQIDLSSSEGKARLTKLAQPLLDKLPEGVFKHMLFERLAHLVRMDINVLKNLVQKSPVKNISNSNNPSEPIKQTSLKRSPMRLAIALLIQNPQLAQNTTITERIKNLIAPGSDLLRELISQLQKSSDLSTGALLEHWRERPEISQLSQLAALELNLPVSGIEDEFLGVLSKLTQLDQEQTVEQLLYKASNQTLTQEEKITLQNLIAATKI